MHRIRVALLFLCAATASAQAPTPAEIAAQLVTGGTLGTQAFTRLDVNADGRLDAADARRAVGGGISNVTEVEPNNTSGTAQAIGTLSAGSTINLTGRVASGGLSGNNYTGDIDQFTFQLPQATHMRMVVDWTGPADVDFAFGYRGAVLAESSDGLKPIVIEGSLSAAVAPLQIVLASKDQPADFTISIVGTTADPGYENNPALVVGEFASEGLAYLRFFSNGTYTYTQFLQPSGEIPIHSGNYSLWHPFLQLEHDGGFEFLFLEFEGSNTLVVDGTRYFRQ